MSKQDTHTEEGRNPYDVSEATLNIKPPHRNRALRVIFIGASVVTARVVATGANHIERHFRAATHNPDAITIAAPLVAYAATLGVCIYGTVKALRRRAHLSENTAPRPNDPEA